MPRHAAPRPTPRWARVGTALVIAWTAVVAPWAVVHTAHDVAVRDGLSAPSISAPAPVRTFYVATAPLDAGQVEDVRTSGDRARFD